MADENEAQTESFTIEGPDGVSETVDLPAGLADIFAEQGESGTAVASDFLVQAFAQQTHAVVHHAEGEAPEDLMELNDHMEEIFERRFDVSLAEAMGHEH